MEALTVTSDTFSDETANRTRSIVYVGDGTAIDTMGNESSFATMVDSLREKQISAQRSHRRSTRNIELMGILANQTGGVMGVVGDDHRPEPKRLRHESQIQPRCRAIWVKEAKLPGGMIVQADRTSAATRSLIRIFFGHRCIALGEGSTEIIGESAEDTIRLVSTVTVERIILTLHSFLAWFVNRPTTTAWCFLPQVRIC